MTDEIKIGDLVTILETAPGVSNDYDVGKTATICNIDGDRYYTNINYIFWHNYGIEKIADGVMPEEAFKVGDKVIVKGVTGVHFVEEVTLVDTVENGNITLNDMMYRLSYDPYEYFDHDELIRIEELHISLDNALDLI